MTQGKPLALFPHNSIIGNMKSLLEAILKQMERRRNWIYSFLIESTGLASAALIILALNVTVVMAKTMTKGIRNRRKLQDMR